MSSEPTCIGVAEAPPRPPRGWLVIPVLLAVVLVLGGGSAAILARIGRPYLATPFVAPSSLAAVDSAPTELRKRAAHAAQALTRNRPEGPYIVVDSYENRLFLFKRGKLLREAICSTGTGVVLRDPRNGRMWVFDTPLGEQVIERKSKNPVWAKPDWAFIEEGQLPPKDLNERFDGNSLGDYGLYMADGYIIHGTLFKSLLGRRVTHGCIRLGDEDLEFVYRNAPIGTRVFLY
ncbi:MAG: L,D-transpeptidase [Acidobacteriota bacterium]